MRDVQEGEELSISCKKVERQQNMGLMLTDLDIPGDLTTSKRLAMLESHYKFRCNCQLCSAAPQEQKVSNKRRRRIARIRALLRDVEDTNSARLLADELLELIGEERLDFRRKEYYNELITVFHRLDDVKMTLRFAEAALQWAEELSGGVDDKYQRAIRGAVIASKERLRKGKE